MKNQAHTPVLDIHAHFIPRAYRHALEMAGLAVLDGGMPVPNWSVADALVAMDRHGVDHAVISVSSPGLNFVAPAAEFDLAMAINDAAASIVAEGQGRFGAFASLPVSNVPASLTEIDRALDVLGLDGVVLETNHRGIYPGHESLVPLLAALNERRACVFLHPTSPACLHCVGLGRPAPLIEFPFDTTRAIVDLIYSGTLDRFPDIRFIVAHAGGTLPYLAHRIAGFTRLPVADAGHMDPPRVMAHLRRLYYDTALSANPVQMAALMQIADPSRILFGSDYPFSPAAMLGDSLAGLRALSFLSPATLAGILGGNSLTLLGRPDGF